MRRVSLVFAVVVVAVLVWGGVASAITYGQPDGNKHPNVGALVGTFDGQTYPYCSGSLISPTVFLTAAHCGDNGSTVYVTFDSTYTSKSKLYSGTADKLEAFLRVLEPFGIRELVQSGMVAVGRGSRSMTGSEPRLRAVTA
jgi:hypothetical protein